jgi:Bacterial Ig-like domain
MKISFSLLVLLFLVITFIGCNEATTTPTPTNKPTIISFTGSPTNLPAGGGSITLTWNVSNAQTLSIDNGVGAVTGMSTTVNITSNTIFRLTATNTAGSVTQTASVSVGAGDTTQPTIISIEPPDDAVDVKSNASIVITFSETMNQTATQAAYESADLPASEVSFTWNSERSVLTIKPNTPLVYAKGESPAIAAKNYTFSLTDSAKDTAGNALNTTSSSFSTSKEITLKIFSTPELDGNVLNDNASVDIASSTLYVGDTTSNAVAQGFLSFNLSEISEAARFGSVFIYIYKHSVLGSPYTNLSNNPPLPYGAVWLEHVTYGNSLSPDDYGAPTLDIFGVIDDVNDAATGYLNKSISTSFQDDLNNRATRGNRSQYRLFFANKTTDRNSVSDGVSFGSSDGVADERPYIEVVYFIP